MYWEYFDYNYNWKPGAGIPRSYLLSQAVRMGDWKGIRQNLLKNPEAQIELYNLKNDVSEQTNVADQYPEIVQQLKQKMLTEHRDSEYFKIK